MALKLSHISADTIKVICRMDSALAGTGEDYQAYLDGGLDESKLVFVEGDEPTRFVLRTVLPYGLAQRVKNEQTAFKDGQMTLQMAFINEEVRCALVDIVNPPTLAPDQWIKFERDSDGGASKKLMELLIAADVAQDLFLCKKAYADRGSSGLKKS
jgi:hypothetical protein